MAVDVDLSTTVRTGIPHELFQTLALSFSFVLAPYDVSADGQRFLIYSTGKPADAPITVVRNWWATLTR